MTEIASTAAQASPVAAVDGLTTHALRNLAAIAPIDWAGLAERAIEPNAYYLGEWVAAANGGPRWRDRTSALAAFDHDRLIGLLPVTWASRAWRMPLPVLVNADPFRSLGTPLLDRDAAPAAARLIIAAAREAGAHALVLRLLPLSGAAASAFLRAAQDEGLKPRTFNSHARAVLDAADATPDLLARSLGSMKRKQLRRQRHRLAEHGEVRFTLARTVSEIATAFDDFLTVEASGWKGRRGTALACDPALAERIRAALLALAGRRACQIATLRAGGDIAAAGLVLRHQDRAFFFKIGMDERFEKSSPGVQLTLELTRELCADPAIHSADSTAAPDHPMIDRLWRSRMEIGDLFIPLTAHHPLTPIIFGAIRTREAARAAALAVRKWIRGHR